MRVKGAVVVITGAAGGIGRATALRFARSGAHVVLAGRRAEALEEVAAECRARGVQALAVPTDITDAAAVDRLARRAVERFGRIDVWVNCASVGLFASVADSPLEDVRRLLDVNVMGYVHGARAALGQMRTQGSGVLVNVSSVIGVVPQPYSFAYAMAKAAVRALSVSLRSELRLAGLTNTEYLVIPSRVADERLEEVHVGSRAALYRYRDVLPRAFLVGATEVLAGDAALERYLSEEFDARSTVILEELGEEHLRTGEPIVYTSADSVFQVAAHVDVVPLATLYAWCEAAREILQGEHAVARVIARPFTGRPGAFERLGADRQDYSLAPPHATVLDALLAAGREVIGVGKIPDIFAHRGFSHEVPSADNDDGVSRTLEQMRKRPHGLIFTNLVEFDSLYGHRRDPQGYADALEAFDERLPELLATTEPGDTLLLVSDHGNDPTWPGTDHTREHGLLLAYRPDQAPEDLGTRATFADVGATVAATLGVPWNGPGTAF